MDGINVNSKKFDWALMIAMGKKTIETRASNSLKSHIGERVYIIRTGRGSAQIIGEVTIGEPIVYHNSAEFDNDVEKHMVTKWCKEFYIKPNGVKYGYPMINPILYDRYFCPPKGGIVIRKNCKKTNSGYEYINN